MSNQHSAKNHHHSANCQHHHGASTRIGYAFALNLSFAVIELIGAYFTNSLAILSDAVHDLGDSLSLGIAWWLEKFSQKKSDASHTYGYRRLSVLSAVISSVVIMTGSLFILGHSLTRIFNPEPVQSLGVVGLAVLGVIFNLIGYLKLRGGESLNEKVLKYHLLEDLLGWVVVLIGGIVMHFTGWFWLDPVLALGIAIWIFFHVLKHFKASLNIFLQRWPDGISVEGLSASVLNIDQVVDIHHLHGWSIDGQRHIVTMHVIMSSTFDKSLWPGVKSQIKAVLKDQWNVIEATLEFEWEHEQCADPTHDDTNQNFN